MHIHSWIFRLNTLNRIALTAVLAAVLISFIEST